MLMRLVGTCALWSLLAQSLPAEIILASQEVEVPFSDAAQSGSLEFYLENTGAEPLDLVAFQLRTELSPANAGIEFTDLENPSTFPYVFDTSSVLGVLSAEGSVVDAGDFLPQDAATIAAAAGLLTVRFEVAGNTSPGTYQVLFSSDPNDTFFVDSSLADLTFAIRHGSITVDEPIPEPGTANMVMILVIAIGNVLVHLGRKK